MERSGRRGRIRKRTKKEEASEGKRKPGECDILRAKGRKCKRRKERPDVLPSGELASGTGSVESVGP